MGKYGSTFELIRAQLAKGPATTDEIAQIVHMNSDGRCTLESAKGQARQRATQAVKKEGKVIRAVGGKLVAVIKGEEPEAIDPDEALAEIFG
jgi:hypothetical protein